MPGDPARMMLGQRADQDAIDEIKKELGLDKSIAYQYAIYLNDMSFLSTYSLHENSAHFYDNERYGGVPIFKGKNKVLILKKPYLGKSFQRQKTVASILKESVLETTTLAVSAIVFALIVGVILGIISALNQDTFIDRALLVLATSGMTLPSFFVGILIAWLFGFVWSEYTGLQMSGSLFEVDDLGKGEYIQWSNLILPALTLGIRPLAVILQLCRNSLLEVLSMDYIRTAKAKGLSFYTVLIKHSLRNALNPVLTAVSGMFASLMAGAVFIEIIFSWKGIGWEIVNALEQYDLPIVMGSVLFIAVIFVVINIIVDILYGFLDPRLRV